MRRSRCELWGDQAPLPLSLYWRLDPLLSPHSLVTLTVCILTSACSLTIESCLYNDRLWNARRVWEKRGTPPNRPSITVLLICYVLHILSRIPSWRAFLQKYLLFSFINNIIPFIHAELWKIILRYSIMGIWKRSKNELKRLLTLDLHSYWEVFYVDFIICEYTVTDIRLRIDKFVSVIAGFILSIPFGWILDCFGVGAPLENLFNAHIEKPMETNFIKMIVSYSSSLWV